MKLAPALCICVAALVGFAIGAIWAPGRFEITHNGAGTSVRRPLFLLDKVRGDVWGYDYQQWRWIKTPLMQRPENPFDKFDHTKPVEIEDWNPFTHGGAIEIKQDEQPAGEEANRTKLPSSWKFEEKPRSK